MSIGAMFGLGVASSALDSSMNLGSGLIANKVQYEQQKNLMDKSFEQQLDFWNLQNEYNSPSAQMRRLRQAGLNPGMLNSNAVNNTAGNLSSVGSPSAPNVPFGNANTSQSASALQSILKMSEETNFIDTQNSVMAQELFNRILEYEIKNIAKQTGLTEAEIKDMEREELYQFLFDKPSPGAEFILNNRLKDAQRKLQADTEASSASAEQMRADVTLKQNMAFLTSTQTALYQLQAANYQREVDARLSVLDAQKKESLAAANKYYADAQLLSTQNGIAEYQRLHQQNMRTVSDVLGFDIHDLPSTTQVELMRAVDDLANRRITADTFNTRVSDIVHAANVAATAIISTNSSTNSSSTNGGGIFGLFNVGLSDSNSHSYGQNVNPVGRY